MDVNSVQNEMT